MWHVVGSIRALSWSGWCHDTSDSFTWIIMRSHRIRHGALLYCIYLAAPNPFL